MLTFIAWIGKAVWPLLAGFMPWGGPKTGMVLAGLLAALVAIAGPAGAVWLNMRGEVKTAVAACSARCDVRIAKMQTATERTISDILSSVDNVVHDGKSVAELCAGDPLCIGGAK